MKYSCDPSLSQGAFAFQRFFFPGSWEAVSRSASAPQNETKGLRGGGRCWGWGGGVLELQAFSITTVSVSAVAASHSAGVPRPWYTIVKRWRGQDVRVCAFILTGRLADDETQIFCVDQE